MTPCQPHDVVRVPVLIVPTVAVMVALATSKGLVLAALALLWFFVVPGSAAANSYLYVRAAERAGWDFKLPSHIADRRACRGALICNLGR